MVIYITTSKQCKYCDAMKRDTWCDETVRHRLARGFVAIQTDTEKKLGNFRIELKCMTYPTTLVGVPEGKIIGHRIWLSTTGGALHGLLSEGKQRRLLGRKRPVN